MGTLAISRRCFVSEAGDASPPSPITSKKGNPVMTADSIHDINATTDYAADKGQSEIDELRRQVKDLTDKYGSMAQHRFSEVKEKVQQNVGDLEQQIRDKPVQATLIAAGVGFLVGALLSR